MKAQKIRKKEGKWTLAFHAEIDEKPFAEPRHRVGPPGVSSGISHRELPSSCIDQVRKICEHYVQKCSGKYSNNAVAARYIHHMADEVIVQLAGVAEQIQRHESNPELFQLLLDEWNAAFPPSLGEEGTPKVIAAKLIRYQRELSEAKELLRDEQILREKDVSGLLRSMDAQLHASREGVINERRQLQLIQKRQILTLQEQVLYSRPYGHPLLKHSD